jgi:hypothetical protein
VCGDSGDERRVEFLADHVAQMPGLHRYDLVNHPWVHQCMLAWLRTSPPERQQEPGNWTLVVA